MLTTGETDVNSATPPRVVMLSIAGLADRDHVSKAAVSRKVKQLCDKGLYVERDQQGRVALVHSVQYDQLRNRFDDQSKAQAPVAPKPVMSALVPADETYNEALRKKTWAEAERAQLKLNEERGDLIRVSQLADALTTCGEKLVRTVDQLVQEADDLAAAVGRDGAAGLRTALKKIAFKMKGEMSDALAEIAAQAPETEGEP